MVFQEVPWFITIRLNLPPDPDITMFSIPPSHYATQLFRIVGISPSLDQQHMCSNILASVVRERETWIFRQFEKGRGNCLNLLYRMMVKN